MIKVFKTILMYVILTVIMVFIAGIDMWHYLGWF